MMFLMISADLVHIFLVLLHQPESRSRPGLLIEIIDDDVGIYV